MAEVNDGRYLWRLKTPGFHAVLMKGQKHKVQGPKALYLSQMLSVIRSCNYSARQPASRPARHQISHPHL